MSSEFTKPFELLPIFRERVWGRTSLEPYFASSPVNERIGEVWFTFSENRTVSGKSLGEIITDYPKILGTAALPGHENICPLLVKLLFTSERLSVQVHPCDEYAQTHHKCLGKTEAWYVLDSQPPGEVAVGFREPLTPHQFQGAVHSGEIESLLDWRKVEAGDIIFVPAGTVHAIGAGVTICEIQENSDVTYRLYDYGRPRELHLERGTEVSQLGPHTHMPTTVSLGEGRDGLLADDYFRIERLRPSNLISFKGGQPFYSLLVCTKGSGTIAGEPFTPGRMWFVPACNAPFAIDGAGSEWIFTYTAAESVAI